MKPLCLLLALSLSHAVAAESPAPMLDLPGAGGDPEKIDYAALPLLHGTHAIVCPYGEQCERKQ